MKDPIELNNLSVVIKLQCNKGDCYCGLIYGRVDLPEHLIFTKSQIYMQNYMKII